RREERSDADTELPLTIWPPASAQLRWPPKAVMPTSPTPPKTSSPSRGGAPPRRRRAVVGLGDLDPPPHPVPAGRSGVTVLEDGVAQPCRVGALPCCLEHRARDGQAERKPAGATRGRDGQAHCTFAGPHGAAAADNDDCLHP